MRHLQPDELIDLAEGARPASSAPHLESCDACRRQLAEMTAMMSTAAEADVPEPSPLFWDHLSSRVREAVDADRVPRSGWFGWTLSGVLTPLSVGGIAVVVLAVALTFGARHRAAAPAPVVASSAAEVSTTVQPPDDPSLDLVADLAAQVDWDGAPETGVGLRAHEDAADKQASQLSDGERVELERLLKEELAHSGN